MENFTNIIKSNSVLMLVLTLSLSACSDLLKSKDIDAPANTFVGAIRTEGVDNFTVDQFQIVDVDNLCQFLPTSDNNVDLVFNIGDTQSDRVNLTFADVNITSSQYYDFSQNDLNSSGSKASLEVLTPVDQYISSSFDSSSNCVVELGMTKRSYGILVQGEISCNGLDGLASGSSYSLDGSFSCVAKDNL